MNACVKVHVFKFHIKIKNYFLFKLCLSDAGLRAIYHHIQALARPRFCVQDRLEY